MQTESMTLRHNLQENNIPVSPFTIIRIIVRNQQKTDGQGAGQPQAGEEDDDADDEPGPGQEEAAAAAGGGHLHCQRQRGPQQWI